MIGSYFVFFATLAILQIVFPSLDILKYQQTDLEALMSQNPWKFILLAVVIAPILEEGMFRTLIKPSPNEFIFFICSWILVIAATFIPLDVHWAIKFGFLLLFISLIYYFLKELIPVALQYKACSFLNRNYIFIWMITAIIFGLVHISNYVDGFQLDFLLFLMIVPRIIAGFYFGKIKIENRSMVWPIAMHALNNATVVMFILPKLI
tara:strand:+ start:2240 stop:2860 length:621 start_codon:yes stop_codon:yes gene_type:complete